ncbi:MAG TPA: deaminase [Solirubrobacteraceae bacterium]|nr:deaminase [Solirubrobacteraceae bacterium]
MSPSATAVVAYVPVLHDGYRRFVERHGTGGSLYLIGPELYEDYRPLAKDIRALPAEWTARSIEAWGVCSRVSVLDEGAAAELARGGARLTMPDEDVSHRVAERFFERCEVLYDTVFLRWDRTRTTQLLQPGARVWTTAERDGDPLLAELARAAGEAAGRSVDWWRQVGAAMRLADGETLSESNEHLPHRLSAYTAGDPRANLYRGVGLELSTATHAEAALIARAAREGKATAGATMFVSDFPCPPCAKLIAGAGVEKLYFVEGYAVLDGEQVLAAAGVEVVRVASEDANPPFD